MNPDVEFRQISTFDAVSLGRFDCIWMEQTFHHVEPRKDFMQLLGRLLRPGGVAINFRRPMAGIPDPVPAFSTARFQDDRYYTDSHGVSHPYGNERITTSGRLRRDLQRVGFENQSVRHYRLFPNRPWADKWQGIEDIVPAWIRPAFTHYNVVARWPG
ncbi:MAG: class I SAM-dependent methyltransferase [Gammaproteobacteria bacterium]|nr:class I SAM-dependent methyltransferase [Gammaproteobacteria bacterium]